MKRVYVAARFGNQSLARAVADALRREGHRVVSRWQDSQLTAADENDPGVRSSVAATNIEDLRAADALVLLACPNDLGMRGALVETAIAWWSGKRVVIVGDRLAITLMLDVDGVTFVADIDAALAALR